MSASLQDQYPSEYAGYQEANNQNTSFQQYLIQRGVIQAPKPTSSSQPQQTETRKESETYFTKTDPTKLSPTAQKQYYEMQARYEARVAREAVMSKANKLYHTQRLTSEGAEQVKQWEQESYNTIDAWQNDRTQTINEAYAPKSLNSEEDWIQQYESSKNVGEWGKQLRDKQLLERQKFFADVSPESSFVVSGVSPDVASYLSLQNIGIQAKTIRDQAEQNKKIQEAQRPYSEDLIRNVFFAPTSKPETAPLVETPKIKPFGWHSRAIENMGEQMGFKGSITERLRFGRDTIFSVKTPTNIILESETGLAKAAATHQTTDTGKVGADIAIGVFKGAESVVNPNVKSATGALVGTGISLVTGKGTGTHIQDYQQDIKGREGEFAGELLFDVLFSKGSSKAIKKVSKVRVGSKTDEILLKYSSRYKKGAESLLKTRSNVVSSPAFDVGQKTYTWSTARQKAIDIAFDLEQTHGTSGVTAPALLETSTKTRVLPHLFSRGGQVSVGVLRETGFSRTEEGLQSAPKQIGIQTQTEALRKLPVTPSRVATSRVASSWVGAGVLTAAKAITQTKNVQIQPQQTGTIPTQKPQIIQTEAPKQIESTRQIPYTPELVSTVSQQKQQKTLIPRFISVPKTISIQPTKVSPFSTPGVIQKTQTIQQTQTDQSLIPRVMQVPKLTPKQTPQQISAPPQQPPTFRPPSTPYIPQFKMPKHHDRGDKDLLAGWRLKTHPVPTIKMMAGLAKPKKRKGNKNNIEKFLF